MKSHYDIMETGKIQFDSARARRFGDFMEGRLPRNACIKRWDGAARTSSSWDKLKQDPELWDRTGNCHVHLFARGTSHRGPAFQIPLSALLSTRCHPLIERYAPRDIPGSIMHEAHSYATFDLWHRENPGRTVELYIPAPPGLNKAQAVKFHVATRNLFAWVCRRSLVGAHLGGAIVQLMGTMERFRLAGTNNLYDLLVYLEEEGYLNMQNLPNHALAILYVAEHFEFREMYIDAFAHCVGMNNQLFLSSEYRHTSSVSQKLIRRARSDYDLRLMTTSQMLSTLLADEFSEHHLGLTIGARHHFDRFRQFLLRHYCRRFGQYPPPSVDARNLIFSKDVYDEMRTDFECLYELLKDSSFTKGLDTPFLAQGGICAVQSVNSFDLRCRFAPLPHPLPRLPEVTTPTCSRSISLSSWLSRVDKPKPEARLVQIDALNSACNNTKSQNLLGNPLVTAFRSFEEDSIIHPTKIERKEKLSVVDARKVRWVLIYGIYQTLRSVTQPPAEVREIDKAKYLLAISTENLSPWKENTLRRRTMVRRSTEPYGSCGNDSPTSPSSIMSEIQPDIDYLAPKYRNNSVSSALSSQGSSNVSRAMILGRSFAQSDLFRRLSIFRNPKWQEEPVLATSHELEGFKEIVVDYYGNEMIQGDKNYSMTRPVTSAGTSQPAEAPKIPVIWSQETDVPSVVQPTLPATPTTSRSHSTSSNSSTSTTTTTVTSYSTATALIIPQSPVHKSPIWDPTASTPRSLRRRSAVIGADDRCPPVALDHWEAKKKGMSDAMKARRDVAQQLRIDVRAYEEKEKDREAEEWEIFGGIGGLMPL